MATSYRIGSAQVTPELFICTIGGTILEDVSDLIREGAVECDVDKAVPMTFSGVSRDRNYAAAYVDFLKPFVTIEYADGYTTREPMGHFALVPPKLSEEQRGPKVTIDARALTWIIDSDSYEWGYTVDLGDNLIAEVQGILNGYGIRHLIPPSPKVAAAAVSFKAGSTKLEVINAILKLAGYYALYALRDGRLASMPWRSINEASAATRYASDHQNRVRVLRTLDIEPNVPGIFNRAVVVKDDAASDPIVGTFENTSLESKISIPNIGYRITAPTIRDSYIADQAAADMRARMAVEEAAAVYTKMTMYTRPDHQRAPHEVYALDLWNANGEQVASGKWWCSGWKFPFSPSTPMTHTVNKTIPYGGAN